MSKSGFVCEDDRRKNVRKPRSKCVEDVFSAEVWLASAPLHEARRTKKSASTLKAKMGIGQLAFVSNNSDAQFNAYLQILSSSKPHSEVASTTHTSALKRFRKDAPLFSGFIRPGVPTSKCRISKVGREGIFSGETEPFSSWEMCPEVCRKV